MTATFLWLLLSFKETQCFITILILQFVDSKNVVVLKNTRTTLSENNASFLACKKTL